MLQQWGIYGLRSLVHERGACHEKVAVPIGVRYNEAD